MERVDKIAYIVRIGLRVARIDGVILFDVSIDHEMNHVNSFRPQFARQNLR